MKDPDVIDAEFRVKGEKPHEPIDWEAGKRLLAGLISAAIVTALVVLIYPVVGWVVHRLLFG